MNPWQTWNGCGRSAASNAIASPSKTNTRAGNARAFGSDWQGRIFVWDTKTGKTVGELEANPPSLAERVDQCARRLAELEAASAKAAGEKEKAAAEMKVAAAKSALNKWQAALQAAGTLPPTGTVSMR